MSRGNSISNSVSRTKIAALYSFPWSLALCHQSLTFQTCLCEKNKAPAHAEDEADQTCLLAVINIQNVVLDVGQGISVECNPICNNLPWVPETFLARFHIFGLWPKMCRPSANTENSCCTREKPLVPRVATTFFCLKYKEHTFDN